MKCGGNDNISSLFCLCNLERHCELLTFILVYGFIKLNWLYFIIWSGNFS